MELADHTDEQLGPGSRVFRRQVGEREALVDGVAVCAGGDETDRPLRGVDVDGIASVDLGDVGVDGQVGELPAVRLLPRFCGGAACNQRVAPDEVALGLVVGLDERVESCLVGADVVGEVAADHVALLHAERVERVVAGVGDAEIAAGVPQRVVDATEIVGRDVELPAELADEADPKGPRFDTRDVDRPCAQPAERLVRQIGIGDSLQELACERPGECDHAAVTGHDSEFGIGAGGPVGLEVLPVLLLADRGGHEIQVIVGEAGRRHLALDPTGRRQRVGQPDPADVRNGVGREVVEYSGGVRTDEFVLRERGRIEDRDALLVRPGTHLAPARTIRCAGTRPHPPVAARRRRGTTSVAPIRRPG